jgi:hypothetical protein
VSWFGWKWSGTDGMVIRELLLVVVLLTTLLLLDL